MLEGIKSYCKRPVYKGVSQKYLPKMLKLVGGDAKSIP